MPQKIMTLIACLLLRISGPQAVKILGKKILANLKILIKAWITVHHIT
jgi:hypothetical protein